jgi:hypothetical protein
MQLPLHAAGIYTGSDQVCCSDYFVSTYVPSIGALLHAQQTFQPVRRIDADTLIVAVENPFEGLSLPLTSKEASTVRHHVSPSTTVTEVSKSPDVSQHIRSASILHMACHGTQNLADALQSGFFLEDELLPVSKLMQLELPRAFLAVLSACETAKSDATQPDQAIHLAATMLYAGFKTVVATMWCTFLVILTHDRGANCYSAGSCVTSRAPMSPRASTLPCSRMAVTRSSWTRKMSLTLWTKRWESCETQAWIQASGQHTSTSGYEID